MSVSCPQFQGEYTQSLRFLISVAGCLSVLFILSKILLPVSFFFFWSIFLFSISLISSVISVVRDIILFECFHHLEGIYKVPSDSPLDDLVLECHYTAN